MANPVATTRRSALFGALVLSTGHQSKTAEDFLWKMLANKPNRHWSILASSNYIMETRSARADPGAPETTCQAFR